MRKKLLLAEHLTISLVVLVILLGTIFASFSLIEDILTRPQRYFSTDLSGEQMQFVVVHIAFVVISVLVSYIIYLLFSLQTRTEIAVFNTTKSLGASLEQFVKFYEDAPVPYIIIDKSGNIKNPNKAALRFFGTVLEEIKDKNIFYYQPEEDKDKIEKLIRYYKSNVPINREEVRLVTKNGDIRWALISIFETKDPESSARTGLVTIFDITDQKKLDQAKTEFVSLASHQLRTPVATVKWYIEMLLSDNIGALSPKQNEYLKTVFKVNEEMIDLVETLLNVSRIEIGTIKIEPKSTDVIELTEGILMELSPQIEGKNINIEKQYDNNLKDVEIDPKLLRIVIQNLISNAVKYTRENGTVSIVFKESFGEKTIVVSDNGIGIPEGQQDKIFTKMFRAENTHKLVGASGTGLGLYLVKSMIEVMGGSISFVSKEDEGSIFTIKF